MKRVLAAAAAVLMVSGSIFIRSRLDDDKEAVANPLRLTCVTELAKVCDRLESKTVKITVEDAGTTLDRLADSALDAKSLNIDGWLAPSIWRSMADAARTRTQRPLVFERDAPVIARAPVVLVLDKDRVAAMAKHCQVREVGWKCVGDVAGLKSWGNIKGANPSWGRVKFNWDDPSTAALGLVVLGSSATGFFGAPVTDPFVLEDESQGFSDWFAGLGAAIKAAPEGSSALDDLLAFGPATYDGVFAVSVQTEEAVGDAARRDQVVTVTPKPVVTADIALSVTRQNAERVAEFLPQKSIEQELVREDWRGSKSIAPGANNLPSVPVMETLRQLWIGQRP